MKLWAIYFSPGTWWCWAWLRFLLFGAKRLPELGKGLGEGLKGFKEGIKGVTDPTPAPPPVQQQNVAPAATGFCPGRAPDYSQGLMKRLQAGSVAWPSTVLEL